MEGTRLKRIETELKAMRDMLDDADQTPFGEMGKLLDGLMVHCTQALAVADVALWYEHAESDA